MNALLARCHTAFAVHRHTLLMGLLVLAMLVRGLVPAGYMPGGSGADQGFFSFEICSADSTVKSVILNLTGNDASATDTDTDSASQACVFAGLGTSFLLGTLLVLLALIAPNANAVAASRYSSPHLPFFAGFPLGSRAPPVL